ncbi:MAG: hypothetical protein K2O10_06360, partial [Muribaculaceae bacterium]|nr:hypothetical protein [Muribaculaceae bacterium]
LASCAKKNSGSDAASALLDEARAAVVTDPARAITLLDSLSKNYASETSLIKEGMALRPCAIAAQTERQIARADSLLAVKKREIEVLREKMRWVKEPRMVEGFYVAKGAYNPEFMNTTDIQARVSAVGRFYVVSSANPGVGHTSVSLVDGSSEATTASVTRDGESNYRVGSGEIITFSPEQSDTIGAFASLAPRALKLRFNGTKQQTRQLSPAKVEAISVAYRYAKAVETARNTDIEAQRLRKQLEIARSQQQRLASQNAE